MNYPELNELSNVLCLEGEIWKNIKDFEGYYQVSNIGRVKRLKTSVVRDGVEYKYKERVFIVHNDSRGYPQVVLNFNKKRTARVHRLVAETFLELPSDELVAECVEAGIDYVPVNHLDENPCNPSVFNLEWCSLTRNNTYGNGFINRKRNRGSSSYSSILVEKDVLEIVELLKGGQISQEKLAVMYGVKQITISNIWTGRSWSHLTGIPWKARSWRKSQRETKSLYEQQLKDVTKTLDNPAAMP